VIRRRQMVTLVVSLVTLAGGRAEGSQLSVQVDAARRQYMAQEYEQVIRLLTPVAQSPIATIAEKVDTFELLGLSYLILGDRDRARDAFENLLSLDPGHVLRDPTESPKLKQFFEKVKESFVPGYQAHEPVSLEHAAPNGPVAGRTAEFAASIVRGAGMVRETLLLWRRAGLLRYRSVRMRGRDGRLLGRFLLPRDASSYQLEYYLEARDATGNTVGRVGSPERPLTVRVSGAPAERRFYQTWWFWTAVGVAAAGAITIGVVAGTAEKAPTGNLRPGKVQLE